MINNHRKVTSGTKTGLEINFDNPVSYSKQENRKTNKILVLEVMDVPGLKTVVAKTDKMVSYVLWRGEDYDKIGNWTDEDVKAKVKEIVESGKF